MSSLSLRRDGAVAHYLGFCTAQPAMYPRSFCTLFWWIILGPLAIIPCWFMFGINKLLEFRQQRIKENHQRQVRALVALYKAEPYEALIDYIECFDMHMECRDRKRPPILVHDAFQLFINELGADAYYQSYVLIHLGIVPRDANYLTWYLNMDVYNKIKGEYLKTKAITSPWYEQKAPSWVPFWIPPFVVSLGFLPFLAIANIARDGVLGAYFPVVLIVYLSTLLFVRMELHTITYQCYRAVKDRTCPIIQWEGEDLT